MEEQNILNLVIRKFIEVSTIPRPSFHLDIMREYLENQCNKINERLNKDTRLVYKRDEYGNVVIVIGEEGESKRNIILQSHMDMVSAKDALSNHNFKTQPIQLDFKENNILTAIGTTLGADNGISMVSSIILAEELVKNQSFENTVLYLLITADEEEGLLGARNISTDILPQNAYLINIDSEDKHEICIGCGGGLISQITFEENSYLLTKQDMNFILNLKLFDFKGGHSGVDINKGQGNSIKLLGLLLNDLKELCGENIKVTDIESGEACNAIPQQAKCSLCFNKLNNDFDTKMKIEVHSKILQRIEKYNLIHNEDIKYDMNYSEDLEDLVPQDRLKNPYIVTDDILRIRTFNLDNCLNFINTVHQGIIDLEPLHP